MTLVDVEEITPQPGSTLWAGKGYDADTGEMILFVGDWRAMQAIHAAIYDGECPTADVPEYCIRVRCPA